MNGTHARGRLLRRANKRQKGYFLAEIGGSDGSIVDIDQIGFVPVREITSIDAEGNPVYGEQFSVRSSPGVSYLTYYGAQVRVEFDAIDREWEISRTDFKYAQSQGFNYAALNSANPYLKVTNVLRFNPLLLGYATSTKNTSTFDISIEPFAYIDAKGQFKVRHSGRIDGTAEVETLVPATGEHRLVHVWYLDDGSFGLSASTAKSQALPLTYETDLAECLASPPSPRAEPVRAFRLYGEMTALTSADDWADTRQWIAPMHIKSEWVGSSEPTVDDDETQAFEIGSQWFYDDDIWVMTDATEGAAVWVKLTDQSGTYVFGVIGDTGTPFDIESGDDLTLDGGTSILITLNDSTQTAAFSLIDNSIPIAKFAADATKPNQLLLRNASGVITTVPELTYDATTHTVALIGEGSGNTGVALIGYNADPVFYGRSANNTQASPTATASGDGLFELSGQGWTTSSFGTGARIRMQADQTWSTSQRGAHIEFSTVENGTNTLTLRMRIGDDGEVDFLFGIDVSGTLTAEDIIADSLAIDGTIIDGVSPTVIGNSVTTGWYATSYANVPVFVGQRGQGSSGSPTVALNGNTTVALHGRGWTGSSFLDSVRIRGLMTEDADGSGVGGKIEFHTVPNNSTTLTLRMTIDQDGLVAIVGNTTIGGTLGVTGAVTLSSTLAVTSTAIFSGPTYTGTRIDNIAAGTPQTVFTPGVNDSVWSVIAYSNGAVSERAESRIFVSSAGTIVAQSVYAATHSIGISGSDVQVTNGAGAARNIRTTWERKR